MSDYLIPNAKSLDEVEDWTSDNNGPTDITWFPEQGGILASHPTADMAAFYASFVPSGVDDDRYAPLLPVELRPHAAHIRDFGLLTQAQLDAQTESNVRHVLRDVCRALVLLVDRRLG